MNVRLCCYLPFSNSACIPVRHVGKVIIIVALSAPRSGLSEANRSHPWRAMYACATKDALAGRTGRLTGMLVPSVSMICNRLHLIRPSFTYPRISRTIGHIAGCPTVLGLREYFETQNLSCLSASSSPEMRRGKRCFK